MVVEGHTCSTVPEAGFAGKTNGELLRLAQKRSQVFITLDKGLPYQQNLAELTIAVLILRANSNRMIDLLPHVPACLAALRLIQGGEVVHIAQ